MAHPCAHLLVDGYNVLHSWPEKKDIWKGGFDVARDRLGDALRILHDREGIRVTLVFDGKGNDVEIERPSEHLTFSYLFAPKGITADTIIEQLVSSSPAPSGIWVVSRDNGIRETVFALGGTCMAPVELFQWIHGNHEMQARDLNRRNKEARKQWGQSLFPPNE